jgi:iron uptake system component EfeO
VKPQVRPLLHQIDDDGGVLGEVENIGPGTSREMAVRLSAGRYVTACKPGMTGDGIRGELVVTDG